MEIGLLLVAVLAGFLVYAKGYKDGRKAQRRDTRSVLGWKEEQ